MDCGAPGPVLLVSDIDDTLTGDRDALEDLWQTLKEHRSRIKLALNSSRPAASVDETLAGYFPADFEPDAIITGLGTEIRVAGKWLESWGNRFAAWPDEEIRDIVCSMGFKPHKKAFQTSGKASFAVPGPQQVAAILERLHQAGIAVQYIYSGDSDFDLLAPGAGKDAAMLHLADHFGIPADRTLAAGDSGNDLALFEAAAHAIAVGNARPELLDKMPRDKTYRASAHHAAGVREGLTHLGILSDVSSKR